MYPILLRIGPLTLHSYGVLVATGFIVGIMLAVNQAKKQGISRGKILDLAFYILIAAIVGSRLLFVLMEYKYYIKNPLNIIKLWEGGLVFFGGLLLTIPVVIIYAKKNLLPIWRVADIFAPSIAIGHAIGRLGCFSAGCCHGKPTDLPWGVTFTDPNSLAIKGVPLHPTQLYEALAELGIFIFLISWQRHKRFEGQLFWLYLLLYSVTRFIIEFFRGDEIRGFIYNGFSTAQGISVVLFLIAIIFIISYRRKNHEKEVRRNY